MMASAEMQELQDHIVVCDRHLVSTAARRIASEHVDAPELIQTFFMDLRAPHQPTLSVHLCSEDERKQRVRHRGEMTRR